MTSQPIEPVEGEPSTWRKSRYSNPSTNCVELAPTADGVMVRNSNHPDEGLVRFSTAELRAFVLGVKAGEFDDLI